MLGYKPLAALPLAARKRSAAGIDGSASGSVITVTAQVVSGSGGGAASVSGQTLTSALSLVSGAAASHASASGQIIAAAISLIPGTASSGGAGTASGQTLPVPVTLLAGQALGVVNVRKQTGARRDYSAPRGPRVNTAPAALRAARQGDQVRRK